jgi:hypothetical protein
MLFTLLEGTGKRAPHGPKANLPVDIIGSTLSNGEKLFWPLEIMKKPLPGAI